MTYILTATLLTTLLVATPAVTQVQQVCAPRDTVVQALKRSYNEAQVGMGLRNIRTITELWVSETTGTWTIIMTNPEGWTCIVDSGISWRNITPDYSTPTTAVP